MVTPSFPPVVGGLEMHVERLSMELGDLGHEVTVLTSHRDRKAATTTEDYHHGVRVVRFRNSMGTAQFPVSPSMAWHLRRHHASYDVVHAHSFHASAALLAAIGTSLPLIFTPHYHGVGHTPVARAMHILYDRPASLIFRRATAVLCVSSTERDQLLRDYPICAGRTTVVPNGVDVVDLRQAEPYAAEPTTILVAGRLEEYKQVHVVIEAMAHLDPELQLIVSGNGPEATRLNQAAERLGIGDSVRLIGAVDTEELRRWQRTASVVITLSRHEAFGLTLLEGAVAGAQVVASDIPAHREVASLVADAVHFVSSTPSTADVVSAIETALAERPSDALYDRVLTWHDVATQVADRYHLALDAATT
jgi:glycosyltransferase involved in cell wall biosynthesis